MCVWDCVNPPQLLLSNDKANIQVLPAGSVEFMVSNAIPFGGQNWPPCVGEVPASVMVPEKAVALLLVTARKPVSGLVQMLLFVLQKGPLGYPLIGGVKVGGTDRGVGYVQALSLSWP